MIHLMLDAGREQPVGFQGADLVLMVEIAHLDRRRPRHIGIVFGETEAALIVDRVIVGDPDSSGFAMRRGCGSSSSRAMSTTITRLSAPTCGAARPMPGALYIVSSMSSISRRTSASTFATGAATFFRRGSGAVMMGRTAI